MIIILLLNHRIIECFGNTPLELGVTVNLCQFYTFLLAFRSVLGWCLISVTPLPNRNNSTEQRWVTTSNYKFQLSCACYYFRYKHLHT